MATFERHVDVDWKGSVTEGKGEAKAGTGAFTLPVKCFVSCLLVRCMSSRTVPNEATPKGFPGPLHPPSPVGVEDARGVMHDARSGCPKMALVAGA